MHTKLNSSADVLGVAHRRKHDAGGVAMFVDHLDTLFEEGQGIVPLILKPSRQGAYVGCPGGHGHVGLIQSVDQMDIHPMAAVHQLFAGPQAFHGYRYLENGFTHQGQRKDAPGLGHDFRVGFTQRFHMQFGHHAGELDDGAVDVGYAVPVHESRRRGKPLNETQLESFFNFLEIGRIEI